MVTPPSVILTCGAGSIWQSSAAVLDFLPLLSLGRGSIHQAVDIGIPAERFGFKHFQPSTVDKAITITAWVVRVFSKQGLLRVAQAVTINIVVVVISELLSVSKFA